MKCCSRFISLSAQWSVFDVFREEKNYRFISLEEFSKAHPGCTPKDVGVEVEKLELSDGKVSEGIMCAVNDGPGVAVKAQYHVLGSLGTAYMAGKDQLRESGHRPLPRL